MRRKEEINLNVPEGVSCNYQDGELTVSKADVKLTRKIVMPGIILKAEGNNILISCEKANKKTVAVMKTNAAHIRNMFKGLDEEYTYTLKVCHVHFPMTCKVDGDKVEVTNFLGEKTKRYSKIVEGVKVEIKGQDITVTGHDLEKTGQTAANMELATKVPNKDRRIFQDGIFITSKPGGPI